MSLQVEKGQYLQLHGESLYWLVGLFLLLDRTEDDLLLHLFPTNFEPKSDIIPVAYSATTG
jgi:hypothetical protein